MKRIGKFLLPLAAVYFQNCSPERPVTYASVKQDTVSYTESNEDFPNPERGFYRYAETSAADWTALSADQIKTWRTLQTADGGNYKIFSTLVYRGVVLNGLNDKPIPADILADLTTDFATIRAAGSKMILRFAYNVDPQAGGCPAGFICPPYKDASLTTVLGHIAQLKPLLTDNSDVIACLQMGFIGMWGENFYSDHFGDPSSNGAGQLYDSNWNEKSQVLKALLDALPADRMIQVRTPQMKQRFVAGPEAAPSLEGMKIADAFTGTDQARIGFHNDCFLSSPDDYGTYFDLGNSTTAPSASAAPLRAYSMNDGAFTAVGGETCDDTYSPDNDCENAGHAQTEMRTMHYSFLNCAYNNDVNNDWQTGGCMDEIKRNLGYRLVLRKGTFPAAAIAADDKIRISFTLENVGYASPFNPRPVMLILRNKATSAEISIATGIDPRKWFTGVKTETLSLQPTNSLVKGKYDLFLFLPDAADALASRPEYSIQLANNGAWEPATGYNALGYTLEVK